MNNLNKKRNAEIFIAITQGMTTRKASEKFSLSMETIRLIDSRVQSTISHHSLDFLSSPNPGVDRYSQSSRRSNAAWWIARCNAWLEYDDKKKQLSAERRQPNNLKKYYDSLVKTPAGLLTRSSGDTWVAYLREADISVGLAKKIMTQSDAYIKKARPLNPETAEKYARYLRQHGYTVTPPSDNSKLPK